MKKLITIIGILLLSIQITTAQQYTKTWKGGGQFNLYVDPANWEPVGMPNGDDVVKIPSGTPVCNIKFPAGYSATVDEIHNYGEVSLDGAIVRANKLNNYSKINTDAETEIKGRSDGAVFNNSGTIGEIGYSGETLQISNFNEITNSGEINSNYYNISGNNIVNTGDIKSSEKDGHSSILTADKLNNNGLITSNDEYGQYDGAGSIQIHANTVTNNGLIKMGDSDDDKGGSIKITAKHLINNKWIFSGNGASPEKNGKIKLKCDKIENKGTIKAGHSVGSGMNPNFDIYFNEVALYSDSILVNGDSLKMEADTLRFVFSYMKLSDIVDYGSLYADVRIEFLATENGVLDLSEGLGQYIMSCGNYDGIHFYCNNIIPPPQGMSYICDVATNVHPADTTIIQAYVSSESVNDDPGNSGSFYVYLKNTGTGTRAFDYSILSQNGWADEAIGTTQELAPFQYDSVLVNYAIPGGMYSLSDTVAVNLTSGDFTISAQSYIHANPDSTTTIVEQGNSGKNKASISPNPFRITTTVSYTLESSGNIQFEVYNMNGQLVSQTKIGTQLPGHHQFGWRATGNQGEKLKPGIYFYRILINKRPQYSGKLILE